MAIAKKILLGSRVVYFHVFIILLKINLRGQAIPSLITREDLIKSVHILFQHLKEKKTKSLTNQIKGTPHYSKVFHLIQTKELRLRCTGTQDNRGINNLKFSKIICLWWFIYQSMIEKIVIPLHLADPQSWSASDDQLIHALPVTFTQPL